MKTRNDLIMWTAITFVIAGVIAMMGSIIAVTSSLVFADDANGDLVTAVKVSGPCSCTAIVYIRGAEVDSAAWHVSGDTLYFFIEMKR